MEAAKGALGPCGACAATRENWMSKSSGALLRKTFVFVGAVARSLHMTQTDMTSIVYIFVIIHIHDSRSKSLMMSCITEFHVCYIEFTQFAMVWNSNGRVGPTRSTNVGSADHRYCVDTCLYIVNI